MTLCTLMLALFLEGSLKVYHRSIKVISSNARFIVISKFYEVCFVAVFDYIPHWYH